MEDPRTVVEELRATKFGIGSSRKNPLAQDMHEGIRHLAAELYQKDLHFVMELVQNADDNSYAEGVVPELEFVLVESDIVGVGVQWTLLVLNNEVGFSKANVESLCSIGRSTKKGRWDNGYIGEKGIGFKSVFLVTQHPVVISNGFRLRFNDAPTCDTQLGFIVPEWAEQPTNIELSDCLGISESELPNTVIVLPIREDKVQTMREQLFQLSPKLVLFLNKIDRLSARQLTKKSAAEPSEMSKGMSVQRRTTSPPPDCAGMIPNNCSYSMVSLSSPARDAVYHVWQHEFPVNSDHEVDRRRDVLTWTITLAFPLEQSGDYGVEPDLYAFLPTKVTAGFPFIINADFLLVSSRDSIRFDSQWNIGILCCISQAFIAAFTFLLKYAELNPAAVILKDVYKYIPYANVRVSELSFVREAILQHIKAYNIYLCDNSIGQHFPADCPPASAFSARAQFFCQPALAWTIDPHFRSLLEEAHSAGVQPPKLLTTQRMYIVDAEVQEVFKDALSVMGMQSFTPANYVDCLRRPNWLVSLPDALYVKLLILLSQGLLDSECTQDLPLVKYLDDQNKIQLLAPRDKDAVFVHFLKKHKDMPILSQWTRIFQRWVSVHFMPNSTIRTANNVAKDKYPSLCAWLEKSAGVHQLSVKIYAKKLVSMCKELPRDASLAQGTMHFILHAIQDGYLSEDKCGSMFSEIPLVDHSGDVRSGFKGPVLLPASVCEWPRFLLHDSWKGAVLCLSESYLELPSFLAGEIGSDCVTQFLRQAVSFDIKTPPDAPLYIPTPWRLPAADVKSLLTWIKGLNNIPYDLKTSLKDSEWVKTMGHGDKKPSMSFFDVGQWNNVLTYRDVPFVDTGFYGNLQPLSSTLKELGMVTKPEDGARALADHMHGLSKAGFFEVQRDTASRWYTYLRKQNWMGWRSQNLRVIWVPDGRQGCSLGSWRYSHECVISDSGGLFQDRLFVLDKYYKDEAVLTFFKDNMGVADMPGTEKYCQLWLDWGERRVVVGVEDCQNAWCVIAKGWESFARKGSWEVQVFIKRCRIPYGPSGAGQDADTIRLARPAEVLYADNLILSATFSQACPWLKFAWYPRSTATASWVEKLVKCYTELGVKWLSDALVGGVGYTSKIKAPPVLNCKGNIGRGVYRAILGYLGDPKHVLSAQARKRMVMQLKNVEVWLVDEVGEVEYTASVGGKVYAARRATHVRWEKSEKRIYMAMPDGCNKAQVAHELAGEVAKGVVGGERVLLLEGLQELLLIAAGFHFDDNAVQYLLCARNLRLTHEDEALLQQQQFQKEITDFFEGCAALV